MYNTRLSIVTPDCEFDTPVCMRVYAHFLYDYYDIISKYMDFVDPIVSDR